MSKAAAAALRIPGFSAGPADPHLWTPRFACGQSGHRLMNCSKYLQECARDRQRANRRRGCTSARLWPADCRRRLHFPLTPYPHLDLNRESTSFFTNVVWLCVDGTVGTSSWASRGPLNRWYLPYHTPTPDRIHARGQGDGLPLPLWQHRFPRRCMVRRGRQQHHNMCSS